MNTMMESIRALAERVAHSSGLEVVELEFQGGGGKHRSLRIFLERDAAGRAALAERMEAVRAEPQEPGQAVGQSDEETDDEANDQTEEPLGDGAIELDMVAAGEAAGLDAEEDELAYLREVPRGVPVAQLSGITHGDCERFARDFGTALDVENLVPGAEYVLEVSSPGLDRKLTKPEEFARFAGLLCKVQTFTAVNGNRHWRGRLSGGPEEGTIRLEPEAEKPSKKKGAKAAATAPVTIALSNIEKAQLLPEF